MIRPTYDLSMPSASANSMMDGYFSLSISSCQWNARASAVISGSWVGNFDDLVPGRPVGHDDLFPATALLELHRDADHEGRLSIASPSPSSLLRIPL